MESKCSLEQNMDLCPFVQRSVRDNSNVPVRPAGFIRVGLSANKIELNLF